MGSQNSKASSLPSVPNFQNPNQNQPKSDENDDDDKATMQIICEELINLVLSHALDEVRRIDDREESGKDEVENVEEGWGLDEVRRIDDREESGKDEVENVEEGWGLDEVRRIDDREESGKDEVENVEEVWGLDEVRRIDDREESGKDEVENVVEGWGLDELRRIDDREESGKDEVENVEVGWGYGGEFGCDRYDDEGGDENRSGSRNGNENDGENENGYEGDSKEGGFNANRIDKRKFTYPLSKDCKFNHPSRRKIQQGTREKGKQREKIQERTGQIECKQGTREKGKQREKSQERTGQIECKQGTREIGKQRGKSQERTGQIECKSILQQGTREKGKKREKSQERTGQFLCKYYLTSGGCKYGKACKFIHSREKGSVSPIVEFNFLGLPIRPGERECPYYMRTGSCKYGSNCRLHHPDPTTVAGADPSSGYNNAGTVPIQAASHSAASSWSPPRALNDTIPYVPMMYPPTQGIPSPNTEWNGYQAPVYPTSEERLPTPAFSMNNPATMTNFYPRPQQPLLIDEYPERPSQPECSYFIKFGECKYRSNCKFHHPKSRIAKANSSRV